MNSETGRFRGHARWGILAAALALLLTTVGAPRSLIAQGAPLTLTFGPGRDATQAGTVSITPQGDSMLIVVNMTDPNPAGNGADQLAHIHVGQCPGVGAVAFPFTNIVNGQSTTTVNASLASVSDGNHSINVHQGTAAPASGIYTACVNLPASGGGTSAATPSGAAAAAAPSVAVAAAPAQATPRPVPAAPPNTGVGPGPVRSAAPASASQVTVAAAPQLPSTGSGGLIPQSPSPVGPMSLALVLALAVLLPVGLRFSRRGG